MCSRPPASLLSVYPSSSPSIPCFPMERGCVYPEYVHTPQRILQSLLKLWVDSQTGESNIVWGQHARRQAGLYVHLSKPGASCLCLAETNFQKLHWSCTHGATIKAALSNLIHSQVSRDHCDCHKYTCYLSNRLLKTHCASNKHSLCIHHSFFFFLSLAL